MRSTTFALAVSLAAGAAAIAAPKPLPVLAMSFEHVYHGPDSPLAKLRKRATLEADTGVPGLSFVVNASLGTPPQSLTFVLDTGSADTVATTKLSEECQDGGCGETGVYDPKKSSTYKFVSSNWTGNYGLGDVESSQTGGKGDFAYEKLGFGNATLEDYFIAIAKEGNIGIGIMGLAYPGLEVTVGGRTPIQGNYSNFPLALVDDGIINTPAFSVWCDKDADTGTILFGGSDTKKYTGSLTPLAIQPHNGIKYLTSLAVTLNGLELKGLEGSSKLRTRNQLSKKATDPIVASVDSGSTGTRVSSQMADPIIQALGGKYNATANAVVVDCKYRTTQATLDFIFPNVTMTVPLKSFIGTFSDNYCLMLLTGGSENNANGGNAIVGVNFIKNVYTVFDMDKNTISFANRDYASTGSNIVALGEPKYKPKKSSAVNSFRCSTVAVAVSIFAAVALF